MTAIKGVVFDLYGTLYDVHSVARRCSSYYPGSGFEISTLWRQKQLEYTWLRSLMGRYASFEETTEDALVFTCNQLKLRLDKEVRAALCEAYLKLDPYPDTPPTLATLQAMGLPLVILSNGSVRSIHRVVSNSGLQDYFAHLISVEHVGIFKPHARVYELAERTLRLPRSEILFVSSNAWDAAGAHHFGYRVCWVNRGARPFDELDTQPDFVVPRLDALPNAIGAADASAG